MMKSRSRIFTLTGLILLFGAVGLFVYLGLPKNSSSLQFDGERAWADVAYQVSLGPRTPGSPGHKMIVDWIAAELIQSDWDVERQTGEMLGHPIQNIIASRGGGDPLIIIGAHYDTRFYADEDPLPDNQNQPVPGANDGASGVAVLLELARTIPKDLEGEIWLVFFDAEDNGRIPAWDWILGSRYFVDQLDRNPAAVVIVDMIGDADLNIHMERNSTPALTAEIWEQAAALGYADYFIPTYKHRIIDDHLPFLQAGIPAVDIIDFDYPYWHTRNDTLDKVSAESLQVVGDTLLAWLAALR